MLFPSAINPRPPAVTSDIAAHPESPVTFGSPIPATSFAKLSRTENPPLLLSPIPGVPLSRSKCSTSSPHGFSRPLSPGLRTRSQFSFDPPCAIRSIFTIFTIFTALIHPSPCLPSYTFTRLHLFFPHTRSCNALWQCYFGYVSWLSSVSPLLLVLLILPISTTSTSSVSLLTAPLFAKLLLAPPVETTLPQQHEFAAY